MAPSEPNTAVKSALRTLDILELVARQGRPLAAHEISTTLGIPVSSLSYLLSTLVDRGYLDRDRRHYRLGAAVGRLAPVEVAPSLAERVTPIVRALTRELNETAGFFVLRDFEIEAVAREIGSHALRYSLEVGQRAPLHAFAAGKAILSTLPKRELDAYFRTVERKAFTPRTIQDEASLRAALDEIRREGIARTRGEHTPGIVGIARAAFIDGVAVGAFSVAVPTARHNAAIDRRVVQLLIRAESLLAGPGLNGR